MVTGSSGTQILNGIKIVKGVSRGKCHVREVSVEGSANCGTSASWGQKLNPWKDDYFPIS